jgi:segregation and condensation protein A
MSNKLSFKLEVFEGPLDLLLYLIDKNKVNIYDIPIASITEQYFEYLELMEQTDLDVSSDFVVIAANLIYIKSKMLLPKHNDKEELEEDPRDELVEKLLEYKRYKEIAKVLSDNENSNYYVYYKTQSDTINNFTKIVDNQNMTIDILMNSLFSIIDRKDEDKTISREPFEEIIKKERITIRSRIRKLLGLLKKDKKMSFYSIFKGMSSRPEIVANFLAVLELTRLNRIFFVNNKKGDVYLHLKKR